MDFLFNGNEILSFIFSLKPFLPLQEGQYLKKSYFYQQKPFSLIFSDTDLNGSSLLVHLNRIFEVLYSSFCLITKPFAFIQSFFLLVDIIHEIKCRPIFQIKTLFFLVETSSLDSCRYSSEWRQVFPGQWKQSFHQILHPYQCIRISGSSQTVRFYSKPYFWLLDSITEIRCKPVFFYFLIGTVEVIFFGYWKRLFVSNAIHSDESTQIFFLVFTWCQLNHYSN